MNLFHKTKKLVWVFVLAILTAGCGGSNLFPSNAPKPTTTPLSPGQQSTPVSNPTAQVIEPQDTFTIFTDDEILGLFDSELDVDQQQRQILAAKTVLKELDLDLETLRVLDRQIGGCLDVTTYDLSPGYVLIVDENTCFGTSVIISDKDIDR